MAPDGGTHGAAPGTPVVPASERRELLPPEVLRFLGASLPQTLTIRGPPGAGKTTFALAVLEQFEGYRAYVTARVPRSSVLRDHPWAGAPDGRPIDLIEYLRFRSGSTPSGLQVARLRDALQARASDLVELSQVLSLPDALEHGLTAHVRDPKLVVVDSWEAWVENTLGPTPFALDVPTTRWELERSLLDRFREVGAHVVLIVEREERARLDYVTDGALQLTETETAGRAERWLSFQKLRGVRLGSVSYPFTLEGGRFQCIRPTAFHGPMTAIPDEPDPGPGMEGIWPGATAMAVRFGRLPVTGATLLEADAETPGRLLARLAVPVMASALRSGGRVLFRPPSHVSPQEIWASLDVVRGEADLARSLRILTSEEAGNLPGIPASVLVPLAHDAPLDAHRVLERLESAGFFREALPPTAHSMVVLFVDPPLREPDTAGGPEPFLTLAALARRSGEVVASLLVARTGDPFIEPVRSRSALHLLLRADRGQFFLSGIRPWTPNFVLARPRPADEATIPYDLVPVV